MLNTEADALWVGPGGAVYPEERSEDVAVCVRHERIVAKHVYPTECNEGAAAPRRMAFGGKCYAAGGLPERVAGVAQKNGRLYNLDGKFKM